MNILLIGSGGREHALAWKLAQSPKLTQLYTLPGNPGTAQVGENLPGSVNDLDAIVAVAQDKAIDLVVVGPEDPLAAGLADRLQAAGIPVFGPPQAAARLEASKAFAKDFMARHGIPTAAYRNFSDFESAREYVICNWGIGNWVIKASGLAAGKGVILPETLADAETALREIMLDKRFGDAGAEVVIEERLVGREVSILAFSDGKTVVPMLPAQDHKRLLDNDEGPNTGGMGVFAPSPYCPPELIQQALETAIRPAIDGLRAEGMPFTGVLFTGLILTEQGPKVLEYNCRFGDPETQAVLPLLDTDLLDIMLACVNGKLDEIADRIRWKEAATVCVVLASGGYPNAYPKGLPIAGLDALPNGVLAFHAGTRETEGQVLTSGGRVLGLTAVAPTLPEARALAYEGVRKVHFEGMQYRTDIGINLDRRPKTEDRFSPSSVPGPPSAYAKAGVDIDAGNRAVALMKDAVKATHGPEVLSNVGAFGGLFATTSFAGMHEPVLVGTTDGVGTKVMLAVQASLAGQAGRYCGIGHDIVNHCINDILVQGAHPLFFMDYVASSKLDPEMIAEVVRGMAEACREAGCALLGGETAEMPGVYHNGHFDVVGALVGVVARPNILPRPGIQPGDLLLGLASSGPHTNGYSLIRRIFANVPLDHVYPELGIPLADALLAPHRNYHSLLDAALRTSHSALKALAHITGGGFLENLPRILPGGCGLRIARSSWPVPPLYPLIQRLGGIAEAEMYRVFNMGIGMAAVVSPENIDAVQAAIPEETWVIGEVVEGKGVEMVER